MGRVCLVSAAPPSVVIIDQTIYFRFYFMSESGEIQGLVYHKTNWTMKDIKNEGR